MTETTVVPKPAVPRVCLPGSDDLARMAETLALAFADDPLLDWAVRDDDQRPAALRRVFALELEAALPHGGVRLRHDVAGVAIWYPPGDGWKHAPDELEHLRKEIREISGKQREHRPFALFEALEEAHPEQPHWYLNWLGVLPGQRCQGIGSGLLRATLHHSDAAGLPAYLEATSPRNLALYQRHGFVVLDQLQLPDGAPPVWLMWREPVCA